MNRDAPDECNALDQMKHEIRSGIRVREPGFVLSPGKVPGTYNVQIGRRGKLRSGAKFDLSPCLDVPVLWPRFAGMLFKGRLNPGDEVDLVVYSREIDAYRIAGGAVDPVESRMFSLSDVAIDLGGLSSLKRPIKGPALALSETELWIGKEDGSSALRIQIDGPLITVGSVSATEFVLLGTTLAAQAAAIGGVLALVPPAAGGDDGATASALANANRDAIQDLIAAIGNAVATKVIAE